jgi:Fe2+ transport system protein B
LEKSFKKLENENSILLQENEHLQKYNVNLQDQTSKYALMLTEEKKEKKDIMEKYDTVQREYSSKVESLLREKVLIEKKYYLLLGISVVVIIFLGWFLLGQNLDVFFSK